MENCAPLSTGVIFALDITPAQQRSRGHELQLPKIFRQHPRVSASRSAKLSGAKSCGPPMCWCEPPRSNCCASKSGQIIWKPREDVLERIYGDCPATTYYLKAATNPAATTTATWAAELVDTAIADFIASEMPQSRVRATVATCDDGHAASRRWRYKNSVAHIAASVERCVACRRCGEAGVSRLADFDGL